MKHEGYLCLDIETGGRTPNDPIQTADVVYEGSPVAEVSRKVFQMRPEQPMLPAAIAVHGVTDKAAALYPEAAGVLREVRRRWAPYCETHVFVGYNHIEYDLPVIDEALQRAGLDPLEQRFRPLDLLLLARKLVPYETVGNHKLDTMYAYLFPDKVPEMKARRASHDALEDVLLTWEVFGGLARLVKERGQPASYKNMLRIIDTPIAVETWPFGGNKGQPVREIVSQCGSRGGIVKWFLGKKDMHKQYADLLYTIHELLMGRDP